jgi:hypothetical protein
MADVMAAAGCRPYLQFGEVQWWYFPNASGMTFYDTYTMTQFQAAYGRSLPVFLDSSADPAAYPQETAFLASLIGAFTNAVIAFVRASHSNCAFEVLYPPDVNETAFNGAVNYPVAAWTPESLDCLKTESFTYTFTRDLDKSLASMRDGVGRGFPRNRRSHLVGISDPNTAWMKEMRMAVAEGVESIVLFALDQFCLIGYPAPLPEGTRRSVVMG